jgi:thiol-disulfide isomerase/thioredoxin
MAQYLSLCRVHKLKLKMTIIKTLSIGVVAVGLATFAWKNNSPKSVVANPLSVSANSQSLPDFMIQDVNGKTINLNKFKGKKVFVNLWATWCGPCRREMPSIENLYKKVNGKAEFVMLSLDDEFGKAINYGKTSRFTLPLLLIVKRRQKPSENHW